MSGSGSLGNIRIRGPEKQREAEGEDAFLYWVMVNREDEEQNVERLGFVTYGKSHKVISRSIQKVRLRHWLKESDTTLELPRTMRMEWISSS